MGAEVGEVMVWGRKAEWHASGMWDNEAVMGQGWLVASGEGRVSKDDGRGMPGCQCAGQGTGTLGATTDIIKELTLEVRH